MRTDFKAVKVLIWDFDGTFYRPNPDLFHEIRISEYKVIEKHTGWNRQKAQTEFEKIHHISIMSATATVAHLSGITTSMAAVEMESFFDRRKFVARDSELIKLFGKLRSFRHYILANGSRKGISETLVKLGLNPDLFEDIVTSEVVGETKPSPKGFVFILNQTGLPPDTHLMLGDRELIDLEPAWKLGMRTCLVWQDKPGVYTDAAIPTIYRLTDLLIT